MPRWVRPIILTLSISLLLTLSWFGSAFAQSANPTQMPTPTAFIPTVTGTPIGGLIVTVNELEPQINVRSGPGSDYEKVGVLLAGQSVVAKGRSPKGEWILVDYPGIQGGVAWVYSIYVSIPSGELPVVEPPATPTPRYTATIDPTLAARFIVTPIPSRAPTFTPPAALVIPTFPAQASSTGAGGIPMGMVIIGLGGLGTLLGLVSLIRGR